MRRRDAVDLAGGAWLGAWAAFVVVGLVVVGGGGAPLSIDSSLLSWSTGHRPGMAVATARVLTATGTGVVPYALVLVAGAVLGGTARTRTVAAGLGVACLVLGQAVRYGVMELAARPRPPRQDWATYASGWSFPSGHTATSALTAGLVILAIVLRAPRGRTALCLAVGCWGVLVGLTRVYLGVHWFSDVIGGWLFAAGWLGLCGCAAAWWLPAGAVAAVAGRPDDSGPADEAPGQEPPGGPPRTYSM
ncbi:phosphatase PAP2 family protein [Streptomyces sp. NPDC047017]|uniref:phosphatase PAP2 family protein n=1 Tax=Streptomyces sp. NPDC047017 TaxID=3155024 RepID=UPI0033E814BB